MKRLFLILLILLAGCRPTSQHVSEAIVRGKLDEAVKRLAVMLNDDRSDITASRVEQLLDSIKASRHFTLDVADDLLDRLKPDSRRVVFAWYMGTYLEVVELAVRRQKFDAARAIWKRNQKVRALLIPSYQEDTPVLGIIDLREAEYRLSQKDKAGARRLLASARQKLTLRKPFDRIQSLNFKRAADELTRKLK